MSRKDDMKNHIMSEGKLGYEVQEMEIKNKSEQKLTEEHQRIDKHSMMAFPIMFFVFNILYWLCYCSTTMTQRMGDVRC